MNADHNINRTAFAVLNNCITILKGGIYMMGKSLITGLYAGVTAGTIAYSLSRKALRGKRKLKARAGRALKNMSSFMDELSDIMK